MEYWAKNCWKPFIKEESLLVLDLHRAQNTDHVKNILIKECAITPIFVLAGCTSIVQPLDVYNAPFKKKMQHAGELGWVSQWKVYS